MHTEKMCYVKELNANSNGIITILYNLQQQKKKRKIYVTFDMSWYKFAY